jgi:DNA repair protein RadC
MKPAPGDKSIKGSEGHRGRLRAKFSKGGLVGLQDYEIVELILTLGQPRKDCKPAAKEAIKRFKNLQGVLDASYEKLEAIPGIGPANSFGFRLVRELSSEYLREKAVGKLALNSEKAVYEYLYQSMSGLQKEVFRVLFLNSQNQLKEIQDISHGTVNASAVFAREVMESAIRFRATALIFVHNHPSGNTSPSQDDKAITRELILASSVMGLKVLDHIIIGDNCHYSFASQGLIQKYEAEVDGMKARSRA